MDFKNANVDARQSSFNHVGRDQYVYNVTINQSFYLFGPRRIAHHVPNNLSDRPSRLISSPETSFQENFVSYRSSDAVAAVDIAVGLIDQIMDLLMDCTDLSYGIRDFALEFESLQKTLTLTKLTIQKYHNKPLGQILVNTITPEVVRCSIVLKALLGSVDDTWLGLNVTSISNFWHQVWWGRWDGDEFAVLRMKLSDCRQSLQALLVALHSVVWMELGNELRAGFVSLRKFHDLFAQRIPSLDHISLNAVDVVSHLGAIIPVPIIFCSTWKDFDYIVQGYCRDYIGYPFIERGDYEVIRAEDNQIVSPSELASTVQSGMKLEMSILFRPETAFKDAKEKCPRCRYTNLNPTVDCGWIQCHNCFGQFQILEASLNHLDEESDTGGGDNEPCGMVDEERSREENVENGDEEIISPASRTKGSVASEPSSKGKGRQRDDNGTQFFRRIRVICMNHSIARLDVMGLGRNPTAEMATIIPDDVLDDFGAVRSAIDVKALVQSARECYQLVENWYEAKSTSRHPAVIAVEKEIRGAYKDYFESIETSVKAAEHCITFAADVVTLFESLSQDPGTDVGLFIAEMRKIVGLAHGDAKDTYGRFSSVRRKLNQIIKRISSKVAQDDSQDPILVLPGGSSTYATQTRTTNLHGRGDKTGPIFALELLNKVVDDVARVLDSVNKFAHWWIDAETMIETCESQLKGKKMSTLRTNMVWKEWAVTRKNYEIYKKDVGNLRDFYPVDKMRTSAPWIKRIFMR